MGPKHFPDDRPGLQPLMGRVALAHQGVMPLELISVSCEIQGLNPMGLDLLLSVESFCLMKSDQ